MTEEIIRGILSDHGLFYLGTVVDGLRSRGVGANGLVCAPVFMRRVVYMQDTNLLLMVNPNRALPTSQELEDLARDVGSHDWEVTFHEIGDVISRILEGDMAYLDWARLPIINQPEAEYLRKIFSELEISLDDCHLALTKRINASETSKWLPLDYRLAQMLAFARTGRIEVNYFTALGHLQENPGNYEVYESAISEIRFRHLIDRLRSIETNARRGIL